MRSADRKQPLGISSRFTFRSFHPPPGGWGSLPSGGRLYALYGVFLHVIVADIYLSLATTTYKNTLHALAGEGIT